MLSSNLHRGLQFHHACIGSGLERLVRVKPGFGLLIERHEVTNRGTFSLVVWKLILKMSNQHAKLRAPVPCVVQPHHIVTEELQQPADAVSNNCGAEMPNMHLLSDVWGGEINNDLLLGTYCWWFHTSLQDARQRGQYEAFLQVDIDKPRPGNLQLFYQVIVRNTLDNLGSNISRNSFLSLGLQQS